MTDPKPPTHLLSPPFWAAMVFCLICFAAAGYVAVTAVRSQAPPPALGGHARPR